MAASTQDQIRAAAAAYGVDPAIALAVAQRESGFNQGARGAAGEVGVFQLMPATAQGLGVDPYNQDQNINGGVSLLAQLYAKFGDWTKALAAYNGGNNPPAVSYTYAAGVLDASTLFGGTGTGTGATDTTGGAGAEGASYDLASLVPDLGGNLNWWLLAAVGAAAVLVLLKRRD